MGCWEIDKKWFNPIKGSLWQFCKDQILTVKYLLLLITCLSRLKCANCSNKWKNAKSIMIITMYGSGEDFLSNIINDCCLKLVTRIGHVEFDIFKTCLSHHHCILYWDDGTNWIPIDLNANILARNIHFLQIKESLTHSALIFNVSSIKWGEKKTTSCCILRRKGIPRCCTVCGGGISQDFH